MGGGLGGGMAIIYNTRRNDFEGEGAMVVYGHLHTQILAIPTHNEKQAE